jgi:gamma-glutamylcyclotransferase (GGCT)/AIG2-like uncharacterized protein YtfP
MGVKRMPGYHLRAMPSASVHLFVYGSLKRGGRHHHELEGATFLGPAETAPGYRLEPLGEYLALVEAEAAEPGSGCVPGELFEVPLTKLPDLDAFEGDAYERGEVPVSLLEPSALPTPARPRNSAETRLALAYFRKAR